MFGVSLIFSFSLSLPFPLSYFTLASSFAFTRILSFFRSALALCLVHIHTPNASSHVTRASKLSKCKWLQTGKNHLYTHKHAYGYIYAQQYERIVLFLLFFLLLFFFVFFFYTGVVHVMHISFDMCWIFIETNKHN